ncbi:MAG: hypothetical protein RMA76_43595 [Deltaproteobacteria bacterium]|jgi:type IV pilus biogenesis protein CpaD/CtpE
MNRWIVMGLMAAGLLACESKPKEAPAPKAAEAAAPVMEKKAADAPEVEVATSVDFEAEAEQEITADNYTAQLDAIAAEIESEN